MGAGTKVVIFLLLVILCFLMYGFYRLINDESFLPPWPWASAGASKDKDKVKTKDKVQIAGSLIKPDPDTSAKGTCTFEDEDLINNSVYSYDGTSVPWEANVKDKIYIDCSQCNQYVVKDEDGCLPLGYDQVSGNQVCTAGILSTSGKWNIPPIKKCPF